MKQYKILRSFLLCSIMNVAVGSQMAWAETEQTNCEIVGVKKVKVSPDHPRGLMSVSRNADEFLRSVYDNQAGFLTHIEQLPIKGILCTRSDIIPTLRDFSILDTGITLSLSDDFTVPDSRLLMFFSKAGSFHYRYAGPELSTEDKARLEDVMEIYNLQPRGRTVAATSP